MKEFIGLVKVLETGTIAVIEDDALGDVIPHGEGKILVRTGCSCKRSCIVCIEQGLVRLYKTVAVGLSSMLLDFHVQICIGGDCG